MMTTSTILRRAATYPAVHLLAGFVWFCAMTFLLAPDFVGFVVATAGLVLSLCTAVAVTWVGSRYATLTDRPEEVEAASGGTRVLPWHHMTEAQKVDHLVLAHYYQQAWLSNITLDDAHVRAHRVGTVMVPHTHTKTARLVAAVPQPLAVGAHVYHRERGFGWVLWIDCAGRTARVKFVEPIECPVERRTCLVAVADCVVGP